MRGEDFASIDNYQNDQQNNMGVDSGSYDPARDSSAAFTGGTRIVEDIQNRNIGGGGDTYNAKQALQTARGITATNPYGYNNPFQGIADFFGVDVNYNTIMSQKDMDSIAEKNYANYVNPMNERSKPGFNNKIPEDQARLQTPFGMPFGDPTGTQTQMGQYREQKPDALSNQDTIAGTIFSALAGAPLGPLVSMNSNPSTFTPRGAPNYEGARDPLNTENYNKDKYEKTAFDSLLDTMYGEGVSGKIKEGVSEGFDWITSGGAGTKTLAATSAKTKFDDKIRNQREDDIKNNANNTGIASLDPAANNAVTSAVANDINLDTRKIQTSQNDKNARGVEAYKDPETRLHSNYSVHMQLYRNRNR